MLTDILRGRGDFAAEWVLVAQKVSNNARWILRNINEVLQHYGSGDISLSPRGSINFGRVTIQRKGEIMLEKPQICCNSKLIQQSYLIFRN